MSGHLVQFCILLIFYTLVLLIIEKEVQKLPIIIMVFFPFFIIQFFFMDFEAHCWVHMSLLLLLLLSRFSRVRLCAIT